MNMEQTFTVLRREQLLIDHAPHSVQFQDLTDSLLRVCSAAAVIPALSAVVGLADAFGALVHPRVYKPAFTQQQAKDMIVTGACGVFDPLLLACFARHIGDIYQAVYPSAG